MRNLLSAPASLLVALLVGCGASGPHVSTPSATATSTSSSTPPSAINTSGPGGSVTVGQTSGRFTVTGNLAVPRAGHTATLLPNGNVLVAGSGQLDIDDLLVSFSSTQIVSPSGQATTTGDLTTPREFHTATLLQNGKVLITGGNVFMGYPTWLLATASAELYDPATGQFTATGNMTVPRTGHTASLLPDGRVLLLGGTSDGTPSAEIYDPAKGTFAPAATPLSARSNHTATVLPSGKVLLAGGQNGTAELYDPSNNTFTAVGSMAQPRSSHTATLLPSGKVLVAGGGLGYALASGSDLTIAPQLPPPTAELFDPQTGTFTSTGAMNTARSSHTATLLQDGTVLLCGGSHPWVASTGYTSDSTAEIYDPVAGSFKPAGSMNTGKFWHTATLLPNGTVLLVGGISQDWTLNVLETFK